MAILFFLQHQMPDEEHSSYQKLCLQNKFYDMLTLAVLLQLFFADSSRAGTPHKPRTKLQRLLRHQQQPPQKGNYYSPFSRASKISYRISEKNNNTDSSHGGSLWNFRWECNKSKSLPDLRDGGGGKKSFFRFPSVSDLIRKCESRASSPVRITHYQNKKAFAEQPKKYAQASLSTSKR